MTIAIPATFELQACQEDCKSAVADLCDEERIAEQVPAVLQTDDMGSGLHDEQQIDETPRKTLKSILKSRAVPPLQLPQGLHSQPVESCGPSSTRSSVRFSPHVEQQEFEVTRAVPVPASLRAHGGGRRTPKITAVRLADGTAVKVRQIRLTSKSSSRRAGSRAKVVVQARPSSQDGSPRIVAQATPLIQAGTPRVVVHASSSPQKGRVIHGTTSLPKASPRVVVRATPVSKQSTPRAVVRTSQPSQDGTPRVVVQTTSMVLSTSPKIVVQPSPCMLDDGSDEIHEPSLQTEQLGIDKDSSQQEEAAALDDTSGERDAVPTEHEALTLAAYDAMHEDCFHEGTFEDDITLRPWVDCTELPSELQFEEEGDEDEKEVATPEGIFATLADDEAIPVAMDIFMSFYADGLITSEELGAVLTLICRCTQEDAALLLQALQREIKGDIRIDTLLNWIFDYADVNLSSTAVATHPASSSAPSMLAKAAAEAGTEEQDFSCEAIPEIPRPEAETGHQTGNEHFDTLRQRLLALLMRSVKDGSLDDTFESAQVKRDAEIEHIVAGDISSAKVVRKELTSSEVEECNAASMSADGKELAMQLFTVFDSAGEGVTVVVVVVAGLN
eukprot:TRINITY_DN18424_c0_g1_i1.p1 TRINITY_DN18424_c0_g1~~TRINITY_DN18424_c0_g1_i1.p1  ORF type:complete len:615 (-),score=112.26 TRINITY_DN18424_c0_g1_i1:115-1959(-)